MLPRSLGYRGSILLLFGIVWLVVGLGTYTAPKVEGLIISDIPPLVKATGWVLTGVYAVGVGLVSRWRDDSTGFVALYVMPAVWTFLYLVSWFDSWNGGGYARGWVSAVVYFAVMGVVMICAGWPEPIEEGDAR